MSSLIEHTETVPLASEPDGVIRVAGTRVTLDTLVEAFEEGATAEELVQQYPVLSLADVYSVLGYFLRHERTVREYLQRRTAERGAVRAESERRHNPSGVRARLLARRVPATAHA